MRQLRKSLKRHGNEDMLGSVEFQNNYGLLKSKTLRIEQAQKVDIEAIESNIDNIFSNIMKRSKRHNTIKKECSHGKKAEDKKP